jgi:hypothetical protein
MKGQQKNLLFGLESLCSGFGGIMFNNDYNERVVYNDKFNGITVDTAYVRDTGCFETGIVDKRYREDGGWMIVEEYDTKEEAKIGHQKWVKKLKSKNPPKTLPNVQYGDDYKLIK